MFPAVDARRREAGFSLVELLVVVVIIGILAAIAIPIFNNQKSKAQRSTAVSDVRGASSELQGVLGDVITWGTTPSIDGVANGATMTITVNAGAPEGKFLSGESTKEFVVKISPGTTWSDGAVGANGQWCLVFENSGQFAKLSDMENLESGDTELTCPVF